VQKAWKIEKQENEVKVVLFPSFQLKANVPQRLFCFSFLFKNGEM